MGQPVKLSDQLVADARCSAGLMERSIAGQIEYWAGLGKAIDALMRADNVHALKSSVTIERVLTHLRQVDSPAGRQKVKDGLHKKPFPHFERVPARPGYLVRTDASGERTLGRLVNREFIAE